MTSIIIDGDYKNAIRYSSYREAVKAAVEINDQTGLTVILENAIGDIVKIIK